MFRCDDDSGCPADWTCGSNGRCYAPFDGPPDPTGSPATDPDRGRDAATDAGSEDAAADSGEDPSPSDAGKDAGTDSATPEPGPDPAPAADAPCRMSGAKACGGHASFDKLVCQSGHWQIIGVCDGDYRCNTKPGPALGSCQPIAPLCLRKKPAAVICDGRERKRCDADLLGYDLYACPRNMHCDADGGAHCTCDSGYEDDGKGGCRDIDDCAAASCGPGRCVDGLNGYTCDCISGFASDGTTCVNVNDCPATDPCAPGGHCVDGVNGFKCVCDSGFMPSGPSCVDVVDCPASNPCAPGTCIEGHNTFTCMCPPTYELVGTTCVCPVCTQDFNTGVCEYICGGPYG
ncbi:MAG TPA: calcium-binding EGF-like domain-containing protein [Polyangiales bacterium]|nr:calcium-binding EGF-like domain-containing protein [Polyangiales bacterium]